MSHSIKNTGWWSEQAAWKPLVYGILKYTTDSKATLHIPTWSAVCRRQTIKHLCVCSLQLYMYIYVYIYMCLCHTSLGVGRGFLLIQKPGLWLTLCRSLENTQQRCGANRQEPRGHAKVWHLLGRLGIHKPDPECILKPAAADVCSMAEGWSGGSQSRAGCALRSPLPLLEPLSWGRRAWFPSCSLIRFHWLKPYRLLKDNQVKQGFFLKKKKEWLVNIWMAVITVQRTMSECMKRMRRSIELPQSVWNTTVLLHECAISHIRKSTCWGPRCLGALRQQEQTRCSAWIWATTYKLHVLTDGKRFVFVFTLNA